MAKMINQHYFIYTTETKGVKIYSCKFCGIIRAVTTENSIAKVVYSKVPDGYENKPSVCKGRC